MSLRSTIKLWARSYLFRIRRFRFSFKKLKQTDVTILSNECTGGVIYNTLSLQFLSPTINIYFPPESFYEYVTHLKEYSEFGELFEIKSKEGDNFPTGVLKALGLKDVTLKFVHYKTFEEGKKKWIERTKRINYNKIFVLIIMYPNNEEIKPLLPQYMELPFKKAILTSLPSDSTKGLFHLSWFDKKRNSGKWINTFTSIFGKRASDEFDFVKHIFNIDY